MSETLAPASGNAGVAEMARLTDRLVALQPPPEAATLTQPVPPAAPAVAPSIVPAAPRPRRSLAVLAFDDFIAACAFIPYALVGLALRLIMARIFFLDGQTRIDGPVFSRTVHGFDLSVVLPMQVKADTITAFLTQYAPLPVPGAIAAYLVSYAEFILPIMLLLGLGTRIAAVGMLIMTAMIQIYIAPEALWTTQIYWIAILVVLISQGAGEISVDRLIRLARR
jgi:putative oxidoreductase